MESREVLLKFMSLDFLMSLYPVQKIQAPSTFFPSLCSGMLGHLRWGLWILLSVLLLFWGFWERESQEAKNAG